MPTNELLAEIGQLRQDLRDATEIIESVADDIAKDFYTEDKTLCGFCHREEHSLHCVVRIAKKFLDRPSVKYLFKKEEPK